MTHGTPSEEPATREDIARFLKANRGARERVWRNLTHWRKSWVDYLVVGIGVGASLWLLVTIVAAQSWEMRSALAVVTWSFVLLCAVLFGVASMLLDDWEQPTRAWARAWWVFVAGAAFGAVLSFPDARVWGWIQSEELLVRSAFSLSNNGFFLYSALLFLDRERARERWGTPIVVVVGLFALAVATRLTAREATWFAALPDTAMSVVVLLFLVRAHLRALNRVIEKVDDDDAKRLIGAIGRTWLSVGYLGYGVVQVLVLVGKANPALRTSFQPFTPVALGLFASGVPLIFLALRYVERSDTQVRGLENVIRVLPVPAFLEREGRPRVSSPGERAVFGRKDGPAVRTRPWEGDAAYDAMYQTALGGQVAQGCVVTRPESDERHTADMVLFPIPGEEVGRGVVGFYTDTSVREIERTLEESFRKLVLERDGSLTARIAEEIAKILGAGAWCFLLVGADERSLVPVCRSPSWGPVAPGSIALTDVACASPACELLWTQSQVGAGPYTVHAPATLSTFDGCVLVALSLGSEVAGALLARAPRLPAIEQLRRARFHQFTTSLASLLLRLEFMELTPFIDAFVRFDPRQDFHGISATLNHVARSLADKAGVGRWALIVGGHDPAGDPPFAIASDDWSPHLRPSLPPAKLEHLVVAKGADVPRTLSAEESRELMQTFFQRPPSTNNILALPIGSAEQPFCGLLLLMDRADGATPLPYTRANLRLAKQHVAVCELMLRSIVMNRQILRDWDWVVHELSNPIFGIRSEARGARNLLAAGEVQKALRRIDALEVNGSLMNRVLDEFEMIYGVRDTRAVEFRAVRLVGDLLMPVRAEVVPYLRERRFSIEDIRIEESAWASPLNLDAELMKAAFFNLFKNAIKFAHPQPSKFKIVVSARRADDGGLVIVVADDGVGVPEGEEARIFERGYRATNAVALGTLGRGLGLAVVRRALQEHGGHVSLLRRAGPTEFALNLPRERVIA